MMSFSQYLSEASKDPWAVMSDADRKEAHRLTRLILKVMPSSPKQKELQAKRNAILAKYFPQWAKAAGTAKEDWSPEYKRSIDCSRPKGFSQRAHCQGRKKR